MSVFTRVLSQLDRYVLRRFLGVYGICLFGFLLLFLVVDGVGKIDDFLQVAGEGRGEISVTRLAIEFYAARIPVMTLLFAPYLTLFAAIACLMTFTRHNELAPMISAGRSVHRILLPVYLVAVALTVLLMVAEEHIVPPSLRQLERIEQRMDIEDFERGRSVPHLRSGDNTFVAARWFRDEMKLTSISSIGFVDPTGSLPGGRLLARAFVYRQHDGVTAWFPVDGTIQPEGTDAEGRLQSPLVIDLRTPIPMELTPDDIEVLIEDETASLSRTKLRAMQELYPDRRDRIEMQLLTRRARPVASFVLLLLGLPFVARPGQRSIAAGLAVAFGCAVSYMAVDLFFQEMGTRGELQPVIAAWFAPVFFTALALARFDRIVT